MKNSIKKELPKIERNIKDFVKDESGAVTKDKILKAGIALGIASFALVGSAAADHTSHTNSLSATVDETSGSATGTHSHHGQHSSY